MGEKKPRVGPNQNILWVETDSGAIINAMEISSLSITGDTQSVAHMKNGDAVTLGSAPDRETVLSANKDLLDVVQRWDGKSGKMASWKIIVEAVPLIRESNWMMARFVEVIKEAAAGRKKEG